MYEEYLMHYGRLGMKWGQHIFGKDRSESRRIRKAKKMSIRQRRANYTAVKRQQEAAKRREKILSNPRLLYKYRKKFSQKEIKEAINRIQVEQNLKDLNAGYIDKGKKFVNGYINFTSRTADVITKTKALNTATGGVLFRVIDKKLSDNVEFYNEIKKQLSPYIINNKDKKK